MRIVGFGHGRLGLRLGCGQCGYGLGGRVGAGIGGQLVTVAIYAPRLTFQLVRVTKMRKSGIARRGRVARLPRPARAASEAAENRMGVRKGRLV